MKKQVIVAGGGASGLVAALEAARAGAQVIVLEKEKAPARKVLASGNGRCNFTNARAASGNYHGDLRFVSRVLEGFSGGEAAAYFARLGVLYREEADGRIFPFSGKSR